MRIEDTERENITIVSPVVSGKAQYGKCVTNCVLRRVSKNRSCPSRCLGRIRKIEVVLLATRGAFVVSLNFDSRLREKEEEEQQEGVAGARAEK